jgi:hypothetical protein
MTAAEGPAPRRQIRRFDVFAEYNRHKNLAKGVPDEFAKGEALWLAKVVASRGGGVRSRLRQAAPERAAQEGQAEAREGEPERLSFKTLDSQAQTDALFDNEIVKRMGQDFYTGVFSPAIARAVAEGSRYEDIRDTLRTIWNARLRQRRAA